MKKTILMSIFAAMFWGAPPTAWKWSAAQAADAVSPGRGVTETSHESVESGDRKYSMPATFSATDFVSDEPEVVSACGSCPSGSCSTGACSTGECSTGGCGSGCECSECCQPFWTHRSSIFGEYLLLRPRNFDVPYVEEINGPSTNPQPIHGLQNGPIADTYMDSDSGGRAGFMVAFSPCASMGATFTQFETTGDDDLTVSGTNQLRSLVDHPLATNAASDWVQAEASHYVKFQLADLEYRWLYSAGRCHAVNITVGARYASLQQQFSSLFSSNDFRTVDTNVQFDGAGLRIGLDFERHAASCGLFAYGKGFANFLGGNVDMTYEQTSFQNGTEVDTYWQDLRIVTILEMELGVGWQSPCGHWRATAGYLVQGWFNTISTETWIDAVQASEFTDVNDAVGFDGLTARLEYRF